MADECAVVHRPYELHAVAVTKALYRVLLLVLAPSSVVSVSVVVGTTSWAA